MVRDVDLVSYLPPFLQEYKENVAALAAENPEFILIWNAVDRVLYNHFIETADSYGLSRYEKLLGIYPTEEDTLESRRSRVKIQWVNLLPYTMRTLLQKLNVLCGNNSYILSHNFRIGYTLTLITHLDGYGQTEELDNLLQEILPCNIVIESTNQIICKVVTTRHFAARLVTHAEITLTHDFYETWDIQPKSAMVGLVSGSDRITISNDFNEKNIITMDARAASVVGYVNFVEIKS